MSEFEILGGIPETTPRLMRFCLRDEEEHAVAFKLRLVHVLKKAQLKSLLLSCFYTIATIFSSRLPLRPPRANATAMHADFNSKLTRLDFFVFCLLFSLSIDAGKTSTPNALANWRRDASVNSPCWFGNVFNLSILSSCLRAPLWL